MKSRDLIIGAYAIWVAYEITFLILAGRYDMLVFSAPLALIPLLIVLIQRRKS
jgi:hypothetical protein